MPETRHESKTKLLEAALSVIRAKGYSATRLEDICDAAGLTKGSFFHHFKSKEELAIAAADYWSDTTMEFFEEAPYRTHTDPLDRVLGYLDFRKALLTGDVSEFACLVGTMVQETYDTDPRIREACERSINGHVAMVEKDIAAAIDAYKVQANWTASSLAQHMHAVLQGAFILAKAKGEATVAVDCVDHLRRYVELLFRE